MNECEKFGDDLSALLDGELPGDRQAEVIAHVDECPACAAQVAALQKLAAGIATLPRVEPPPGFLVDVRQKLQPVSVADRFLRPAWLAPIGAVAALVITVWLWPRDVQQKQTPVAVAKSRSVAILPDPAKQAEKEIAAAVPADRLEAKADMPTAMREKDEVPAPPGASAPVVLAESPVERMSAVPAAPLPAAKPVATVAAVDGRASLEVLVKELRGRVLSASAVTNGWTTVAVSVPRANVAVLLARAGDMGGRLAQDSFVPGKKLAKSEDARRLNASSGYALGGPAPSSTPARDDALKEKVAEEMVTVEILVPVAGGK